MAISQTLYSSKTDLWETPQELFDSLNQEFHFDLDVCAMQNAIKGVTWKCVPYMPEPPKEV